MFQKFSIKIQDHLYLSVVSIFILLGLLKPVSVVDSLEYFLVGLLAYLLLYKHKEKAKIHFLIYFFAVLILSHQLVISQRAQFWLVTDLLIILGIIYGAIFYKFFRKYKKLFLIHVLLIFIITAFVNSQDLRKVLSYEPRSKAYFSDHLAFLRKFYLVNKGYDYYSSVVITELEDGRASQIPPKYWNWRLPYINYFWKYLPGKDATSIYVAFVILSSTLLLVSYLIGTLWLNSNTSSIIPCILFPYLHFAARDISFLDPEVWSMIFFVLGLYMLIKKNQYASFLFITFSLMIRELYFIPVVFLIVFAFITKNLKQFKVLMFSMFVSILFLVIHYYRVSAFLPLDLKLILPDSHNLNFYILQQTLSYYSWEYLLINYRPFLIMFLIFIISIAVILIKGKIKYNLLVLLLPPLVLIFITLKNGTKDGDYWGVTFVPLIMIASVITSFKSYKIWKQ